MFIDADSSAITVAAPWDRPNPELVTKIAEYPVALIGDVVGRMGMMTSFIRPQTTCRAMAGSILPVLTRDGDNLAIHRALDEAQPGDLLVIDAHAETHRAVFGDILGEVCRARGVVGVVIDGAVRDVDDLDALGLPVFARAVNPAGPAKAGPGVVGHPVAVGNIVCSAGDVLVSDRDGVIVLGRKTLGDVLARLAVQDRYEEEMKSRIRESSVSMADQH